MLNGNTNKKLIYRRLIHIYSWISSPLLASCWF